MQGFYQNPWGPTNNSMLAGDTTYNGLGSFSSQPAAGASSSGAGSASGMGYFSLATTVIGAVGDYYLSKTQAKAAKSSLQFQRDMAQINARMSETAAQSVMDAGQKQASKLGLQYGKVKSAQRASMAANGIDLGVGNAAEVQAGTDLMKEIDMNQIEANAVRAAWGYRTQSVNYQNQSLMAGVSADSISTSGAQAALGGATAVARSWYAMNKTGVF